MRFLRFFKLAENKICVVLANQVAYMIAKESKYLKTVVKFFKLDNLNKIVKEV